MSHKPIMLSAMLTLVAACNGGSGAGSASESGGGVTNPPPGGGQSGPLTLSVEDDGVLNRETSLKWIPPQTDFPYTSTRDFYIFEDAKVALEARLAAGETSEAFSIAVFIHRFAAADEGSVLAWANNQYSDHLMLDPATLKETQALPEGSGEVQVASFSHLDQWQNPFYTVEYFVDAFVADDIILTSFTATAEVPQPKSLE